MTIRSASAHPGLISTSACQPCDQGARRLTFRIGGISFGLVPERGLPLKLETELQDFAFGTNSCDVNLSVSRSDSLAIPRSTPLFRSGGLWTLFEEQNGYRFTFQSPWLGPSPYKEAWFDRKFQVGLVLLCRRYFDTDRPVYPLEYPLDELLMIHRLSRGEGIEVHAVGIVDEAGRGHLLLGHSGAGKSTTARLWKGRPGVHILSDDRIVVRLRGGRVWMYGTPWHGDAGICSPDCAPVSRIYLLEHGIHNELRAVPPHLAAAEIFARSFVTHHLADGIQFALDFLDGIVHEVPCLKFRFVPNASAVEAICHGGS
jgi:hypothetical protein